MEPIRVPRPPDQAFNKNRRISDLIRAQTDHLKHLEEKLSPSARRNIPQHAIVTEADAATYIEAMTLLFRTQGNLTVAPAAQRSSAGQPIPIRQARGLQLAASAERHGRTQPADTAKTSVKTKKSSPSTKRKKR